MTEDQRKDGPRKLTLTWEDNVRNREALTNTDGLEYLKMMIRGELPYAPFVKLMGLRLTEAERGRVVFEFRPAEYHYNIAGTVHGGATSTLLDHIMGHAVHSTLSAGLIYTTLEIKVNFVRPMTVETGLVTCEAEAIYSGQRIATAEGRLMDEQGRILAHGVTTCLVFKAGDGV